MKDLRINFFAVLVAIILQILLGVLWYGPLFFEPWLEMIGLDSAAFEADPVSVGTRLTNILSAVLSMYVLAWLFVKIKVESMAKGVWIGFVISFSFIMMSKMAFGMFEKDPYWLAWIDGGYSVIGFMLGGAVLGVWRKYKS